MPAGAYYNEIDPYAAQWLRNLIAAGHIAPGDVDERSNRRCSSRTTSEATPSAISSPASAAGAYALRLAGWPDDRPVWTGSCPCQPLSGAGQRKGHADERHLWPAFHRLIAECRPAVVFGEQVASKDGREWLAAVRADLEGTGYACGAADLCAAGVGAIHQRQRLFWCADLHSAKSLGERRPDRPHQATAKRSMAEAFQTGDRRFAQLVAMGVAQRAPAYPEAVRMVDGIPGGVAQLRAYGNAIVPQVAAEIDRGNYGAVLIGDGRRFGDRGV